MKVDFCDDAFQSVTFFGSKKLKSSHYLLIIKYMMKLQILSQVLLFVDGQEEFDVGDFWDRLLLVGKAWVKNDVLNVNYPHCEVEDSRLEGRERVIFYRMFYAGGKLFDEERRMMMQGARHLPDGCKSI